MNANYESLDEEVARVDSSNMLELTLVDKFELYRNFLLQLSLPTLWIEKSIFDHY